MVMRWRCQQWFPFKTDLFIKVHLKQTTDNHSYNRPWSWSVLKGNHSYNRPRWSVISGPLTNVLWTDTVSNFPVRKSGWTFNSLFWGKFLRDYRKFQDVLHENSCLPKLDNRRGFRRLAASPFRLQNNFPALVIVFNTFRLSYKCGLNSQAQTIPLCNVINAGWYKLNAWGENS